MYEMESQKDNFEIHTRNEMAAKYKYKYTLEMRWRPNGEEEVGGLGRLGEWGQLTISEGGL